MTKFYYISVETDFGYGSSTISDVLVKSNDRSQANYIALMYSCYGVPNTTFEEYLKVGVIEDQSDNTHIIFDTKEIPKEDYEVLSKYKCPASTQWLEERLEEEYA